MARAGVTPEDITRVVPHQANIRIIDSACDKLGFSRDQTALVLQSTGNTSAASIPLALADALDQGRVRDGDLVLLVGFGAGMTWASAVLRWSEKGQIGSASCRERVCQYVYISVVAVSLKKKNSNTT